MSVLMCVYNDERFVSLAIESILQQQFRDFEFVIIDDGSTDRTPSILADFARRDARIVIHRQTNAGTTKAANTGLALARGVFVARLDSDDISFPHRLADELAVLSISPDIGLVGGGAEIIDVEGRVIGTRNIVPRVPSRTLRHRCIYQQSDVMFRRELVLRLGGYREKFRNAQDYDLWLRIDEVARIVKLDRILGQWRLNAGGYTLSRKAEQKREVAVIKRLAARRARGLPEGYEAYRPLPPPPHRTVIDVHDYQLVIVMVMLKALRVGEARRIARELLNKHSARRVRLIFILTYVPRPLLAALWSAREFYLNHIA